MERTEELNNALNNIPQSDPAKFQTNAISWLFFFIGALAVIMIIVSGIKMTTSAGDPGAVQKAKQTLIYSIVGLLIAIFAYAIVTFVIGKLG